MKWDIHRVPDIAGRFIIALITYVSGQSEFDQAQSNGEIALTGSIKKM